MSINQKSAVYVAVCNVLAERGIGFDDGMNAKELLGTDGVKQVKEIVCLGLIQGEVEMTTDSRVKYSTPEAMKEYTSGLVSNHLRKDTRLNGGEKYVPANPGSRTGSSDEVIKELKKLRAVQADNADAVAMIDEAIAARTAELALEKAKTVEIDVSKLPESLKHLVG